MHVCVCARVAWRCNKAVPFSFRLSINLWVRWTLRLWFYVCLFSCFFLLFEIFLSGGFSELLVECKTLQELRGESRREREWDLFAPDPHYSTLSISAVSLSHRSTYTHTGLKHTFPLTACSFVPLSVFAPIKFSVSLPLLHLLLSVTVPLSLFISSPKPCYASCLNALSFSSEGCVVRAELKAKECSTQSQDLFISFTAALHSASLLTG